MDIRKLYPHFARFHFGNIQNIVNDGKKVLSAGVDVLNILFLGYYPISREHDIPAAPKIR